MTSRAILLWVVGGLVVASCGGGGSTGNTQADTTTAVSSTIAQDAEVTTTAGTSSIAETTGPAEPVSYGPATLVSGQEVCEVDSPIAPGETTFDSDGTVHIRDGQFRCTVTNNDPRIAGTAIYTYSLDRWKATAGNLIQFQWGNIRIENEGGAWEADFVGIFSPETGDIGAELFTGTGGYEGLYYYQWVFGTLGQPWPTNGLIFPDTVPIHTVPTP